MSDATLQAATSQFIMLGAAPAHSKAKRAADLLVASLALTLLLPFLLFVALSIRLDSHGDVLFRQRRGGIRCEPFVVFKFRTMTVAEDGDHIHQAQRGDPRVTRLGALLRRTSVDELPQLINVLKGEMSLVGPRPHALAHDVEFQARLPGYSQRFAVKPGITGLAQIRGHRGETGQPGALEQRLADDLEYIERWNFWSDISLLVATLKVPLEMRAY
jgi:lipopolysaccharide/colanic/teichoic acid biosynthesis glycosyltransferase